MTETRAPYRATYPRPYHARRIGDRAEVYHLVDGVEIPIAVCTQWREAVLIAQARNLLAIVEEIAGVSPAAAP